MENITFNIKDVIDACLITTKKADDRQQLKQAEKYLIAFQKSGDAWSIIYEILTNENLELAVYAQTSIVLKQKLQYDFYQVSQTEYINLTKAILELLMKHSSNAVTESLSFCFVLIYMRTFESAGDLIDILKQTFFQYDQKSSIGLSILKIAVEVLDNNDIIIEKAKKNRYATYLDELLKYKILELLDDIGKIENLNEKFKHLLLDTFQEWFYFSRKDEKVIKNISQHSCFALALNSINNSYLAMHSRESISSIIKAVKAPENHRDIFEAIFAHIFDYMPKCNEALKEDPDLALEYIKVFRSFGIKFTMEIITSENDNLLKFLQYMVELTESNKLRIEGFIELEEFWSSFIEDFVHLLRKNKHMERLALFKRMFQTMVSILLKRMQMSVEQLQNIEKYEEKRKAEDENENDNDRGEEDEDQDYNDLRELDEKNTERSYAKDIFVSIQEILGFQETFDIILKEIGNNINTDMQNFGWNDIARLECFLFATTTSIKYIRRGERPDLNNFFQIIMAMKLTAIKFNRNKIYLIEEASSTLDLNEGIMSEIFKYLAGNLQNPRLARDAGEALITVCGNWNNFVIKNFDSFIELRNQFDDDDHLVVALASALGYAEESEGRDKYLAQLCLPFAERILALMQNPESTTDTKIIYQVKENIRKLQIIFDNMPKYENDQNPHPLEAIFQDLWEKVYKQVFLKYKSDERIIVRLCKSIKLAMKAMGPRFKIFIVDFLEVICEIFITHPVGEFLYSLEIAVSVLGKLPEVIPILNRAYDLFSEATLNYLSTRDLKEHSEFLEDFFGMLFRYSKHIPSVVLSSKTLEMNLHLAEITLGIDQPNVEKALFLFLEYLFKLTTLQPQTEYEKVITDIIVNKYGAIYINKVVYEFTKYPSELLRNYISDIQFQCFIKLKDYYLRWLENSLKDVEEIILTGNEKKEMIKALAEIDVSNLKWKNKDDEEVKKMDKILVKFAKVFDLFEYRCQLKVMRDYDFERARV